MPLDAQDGQKALQLMTSRYNQREWRKKIEKMLSLPPSGMENETQRKVFLYLKRELQAYKSRRADPPSWIVGGFATKEVIDRARFKPTVINEAMTNDDVKSLGVDPGEDIDGPWWEEMLVRWYVNPEDEEFPEESEEIDAGRESAESRDSGEGSSSDDTLEDAGSVSKD